MPSGASVRKNGPLPIATRAASSLSLSSASRAISQKVPRSGEARLLSTVALGSLSVTTTVRASGAVTLRMGAAGETSLASSLRRVACVLKRCQEAVTSPLSSARPLTGSTGAKRATGLRCAVSVSLSGDSSHDSAASPSISPAVISRWPSAMRKSWLKPRRAMAACEPGCMGSKVMKGAVSTPCSTPRA